jgi:hypothetical protein
MAAWNLCRIQRLNGRWLIDVTCRSFDPLTRQVTTRAEFSLSS